MKQIINRLKKPTVITQLISITGGLIMFFVPDNCEAAVAAVSAAVIAIINVLAGIK